MMRGKDAQKLYFEGCTSPGAQLVRDAGYLKNKKALIVLQPTLYVDSKSLEGEKQWRQGTLSATYIDPSEYERHAQVFQAVTPV